MSKEEINQNTEAAEEQEKEVQSEEQIQESRAEEPAAGETEEKEETLVDPVEALKAEVAQLKDSYLRKVAEFENYRKRTLKEKTELILNGSEKAVGAVLPVLDDLERAVADKTEDPDALKKGTELILNKFVKTLESLGVKKIETEGKDFDVDYHEAVAMVPGMGDDKKGKVIDCVQTGYMLNDKVIRHAKVAVGQ